MVDKIKEAYSLRLNTKRLTEDRLLRGTMYLIGKFPSILRYNPSRFMIDLAPTLDDFAKCYTTLIVSYKSHCIIVGDNGENEAIERPKGVITFKE